MNREKKSVPRNALAQTVRDTVEAPISAKGTPDIPMIVITSLLVLFGCVMVYSASAVYARQYHDDSTYFIVRHLIFLVIAIAAASVFFALLGVNPQFASSPLGSAYQSFV